MNRRRFLQGIPLTASLAALPWESTASAAQADDAVTAPPLSHFHSQAFAAVPKEKPYAFTATLTRGGWKVSRDPGAKPTPTEMMIPSEGWSTVLRSTAGTPLARAAADLRGYLRGVMQTAVAERTQPSLAGWRGMKQAIVAGTRQDLPGLGAGLTRSKDYQILVSPDRVVVCGYDEAGAMFGLYNLEERFDLREAPFLPRNLDVTRHSLYRVRMAMSGLGWMEWPEEYLAWLPRYGFDAIFTSVYSNPDGSPIPNYVTAGGIPWGPTYPYRRQDPAKLKDVVDRAGQLGLSVYCQINYQYTGTQENVEGLRKLVRSIVTMFPTVRGYILLTEGFWYDKWFSANPHHTTPQGNAALRDWITHWAKAVSIVSEECRQMNPAIEILPWDYNVSFRASEVDLKKFVIDQLPKDTIPLVTWEDGKTISFDGESGWAHDYSVSVVGPAEVAAAQIAESKKRGMRGVYTNGDTWSSQQLGTFPHLPFPYQWYERYQAMEKSGVDGLLECWTPGLKPNFIVEMRSWYCWTGAPPLDDLLRQIARRDFGSGSEDLVLDAWKHLSNGIRLDPNTGPSALGYNAVANPLFLEQPEDHIQTIEHSFWDQKEWDNRTLVNPYWPYVWGGYLFYPDFSNRKNMAEENAQGFSLNVFTKYLVLAAEEMDKGLASYRQAALQAPAGKQENAFREVLLAEQVERMLRSGVAILEFENLRFHLVKTDDQAKRAQALDRMTEILKEEIARTQLSLKAAERDSRLGYEWENDYVYFPEVLRRKLALLEVTLKQQIPACRNGEPGGCGAGGSGASSGMWRQG